MKKKRKNIKSSQLSKNQQNDEISLLFDNGLFHWNSGNAKRNKIEDDFEIFKQFAPDYYERTEEAYWEFILNDD